MLTKLTKKQIDLFPSWVDKWVKEGLNTNPVDQQECKEAIKEVYKVCSLKEPKIFVFLDSPYRAALGVEFIKQILSNQVHNQVRNQVHNQVYDQVCNQVNNQVYDQVCNQVANNWQNYLGGQFWLGWQAFESFFDEVCLIKHNKLKEARVYRRAQKSCCWWFPYDKFVVVCNRPKHICINKLGLHSTNSKALEFRDGWGLYCLEGINITTDLEKFIEENNLTDKSIDDIITLWKLTKE